MTRRRRRQDARWSASFSLTIVNGSVRTPIAVDVCDADLESLLKGLVGRAQFRFRFNGKSRAYSVPLVNGADEAVAFRNLLRVAITEDWDLVGSRPTPPQPVASGHDAEVIDASSTATGSTKVRSDATGGELDAPLPRPGSSAGWSPTSEGEPKPRSSLRFRTTAEGFEGSVFKASVTDDYAIVFGGIRHVTPDSASTAATSGALSGGWAFWTTETPFGSGTLEELETLTDSLVTT